jgi:2-polyprenyl-3-methyl-5-hydroxy-6-metoxy-1,4-benzoquinol methylase
MDNWIDYWSTETQFVCDRHKNLSYEEIYRDLQRYLNLSDRILDFGCGEGLFAKKLSNKCRNLYLYDASKAIQDRLKDKFKDSNIQIINDYKKAENINLVIISSVSQYIPQEDFFNILNNLKSSISKNGKIIISDLIPEQNSIVTETIDLLKISIKNRFLCRAIIKMLFSFFGNYRKIRQLFPLTKYNLRHFKESSEMLGFFYQEENINLGLNSNRKTITLTKTQ